MKYPKISIVTPSYNQAEFLEQTICSVLNQNYPNLEYVIIDGGSTDGSIEIIKKYADRLTYWVSEKDKGQYDAINKGFSHTTGDIMGWVNSSDIYFPWAFGIVSEIFENHSEVQWLSGMPTNLSKGVAPQTIYYADKKNKYDIICGNYKWMQQESIFWKRSLWNKAGGKLDVSVKYAGDFKLWIDFFKYECLYYVNTILAGLRYHEVRRGEDSGGIYYSEAENLYKQFKSQSVFQMQWRGFIAKMFISNNKFLKRLFKKLGIFRWYKHYSIFYDYNTKGWKIGNE